MGLSSKCRWTGSTLNCRCGKSHWRLSRICLLILLKMFSCRSVFDVSFFIFSRIFHPADNESVLYCFKFVLLKRIDMFQIFEIVQRCWICSRRFYVKLHAFAIRTKPVYSNNILILRFKGSASSFNNYFLQLFNLIWFTAVNVHQNFEKASKCLFTWKTGQSSVLYKVN